MRKTLVALVVLAALCISYAVSPFVGLYRLVSAAQAGETKALGEKAVGGRSAATRPSAAARQAATRDVRPPKTAGDPARTTTAWWHVAVNFPNYHSKSISSRFKVLNFSMALGFDAADPSGLPLYGRERGKRARQAGRALQHRGHHGLGP